jgi:CDP-glucose 4,6-dehydratase
LANVGGVVSLLDAVRHAPSVAAVVVITSDKCYDNKEWLWGYRETDALGGRDPYSASKGCAEIATRSMQTSFFAPFVRDGHPARIATVRTGNVIGGGDWSDDRLVPDIVRGCLSASGEVVIRNPRAVRPWQHVLDPLAAYIQIAERLTSGTQGIDEAWNIGPNPVDNRAVVDVAEALIAALGAGRIVADSLQKGPHEANLLMLDCAKARSKLGWQPQLDFDGAIALTAAWYSAWHKGDDMAALTLDQIAAFERSGDINAASRESDRTSA